MLLFVGMMWNSSSRHFPLFPISYMCNNWNMKILLVSTHNFISYWIIELFRVQMINKVSFIFWTFLLLSIQYTAILQTQFNFIIKQFSSQFSNKSCCLSQPHFFHNIIYICEIWGKKLIILFVLYYMNCLWTLLWIIFLDVDTSWLWSNHKWEYIIQRSCEKKGNNSDTFCPFQLRFCRNWHSNLFRF